MYILVPKHTFKLPHLNVLWLELQLLCDFPYVKGLLQVTVTSFILVLIFSAALKYDNKIWFSLEAFLACKFQVPVNNFLSLKDT